MKKYCSILLLACTCLLASCSKFLEESSQDEIRPTTTADLYALLIGTAYPYQNVFDTYLDLLTDDIQCNGVPRLPNGDINGTFTGFLNNGYYLFRFDPNMFERTETAMSADQNSWLNYYKLINGCNLILDYIGKVNGPETEKKALEGQALFLRGYYYFKLANIYGRPYDEPGGNPAANLAVPLILSSKVSDERKTRNTVQEVYAQVEKDLLQAEQLLEAYYAPTNTFRVGHITAKAILSRFYLYKGSAEDLKKAAAYASAVIELKPSLTLLSTYFNASNVFSVAGIFDPAASQEVIWNYGVNPNGANAYFPAIANVSNLHPPFAVSNQLAGMYDKGTGTSNQGDLRYLSYFVKYTVSGVQYPLKSLKIGVNATSIGDRGIRVAEMYLNRAEAIIRLNALGDQSAGALTKALEDLNTLRIARYDTRNTPYQPVTITDSDELWAFCQDERRKELCLEDGHRWFDIRRWRIPVKHTFIDANNQSSEHELPAGSLLYALPVPYQAIEANNALQPNPR